MKTNEMLKNVTVSSLLTVALSVALTAAILINPGLAFAAEGDGRGSNGPDLKGASIPVRVDRLVTESEVTNAMATCAHESMVRLGRQAFGEPKASERFQHRHHEVIEPVPKLSLSSDTRYDGISIGRHSVEDPKTKEKKVTSYFGSIRYVREIHRAGLGTPRCVVTLSGGNNLQVFSSGCLGYVNNPELDERGFVEAGFSAYPDSAFGQYGILPYVEAKVLSEQPVYGQFGEVLRYESTLKDIRVLSERPLKRDQRFGMTGDDKVFRPIKLKLNTSDIALCIQAKIQDGEVLNFEIQN